VLHQELLASRGTRVVPNTRHPILRCCLLNARSIANKLQELHIILYGNIYDIVLITESWLHPGIPSGLLDPESKFHVFRRDRSSRGGGVCVFVKRTVCAILVNIDEKYDNVEILCFDIVDNFNKLRFFVVYRPPNSGTVNFDLLTSCLSSNVHDGRVNIITGDFNCPGVDWNSFTCASDYISSSMLDFVSKSALYQFVNFPTRDDNVLDLVLSDHMEAIYSISSGPPLGLSDHCCVNFNVNFIIDRSTFHDANAIRQDYSWYRADFTSMVNYLSCVDWYSLVCNNPSASAAWDCFISILRDCITRYVPLRAINNSGNIRYPRHIRKLFVDKRCIWRLMKSDRSSVLLKTKYRDCVMQIEYQLKCLNRDIENNLILSNNLGQFYRYVNKRISNRATIGPLVDCSGGIVNSDEDKAILFNKYFSSVGVVDNGILPQCLSNNSSGTTLDSIIFTETNVRNAMRTLKSSLSCGPDGLPPIFFKRMLSCLPLPLSLLYQQLMSVSYVPEEWKKAIITPVFKKGETSDVSNYRPISLTCVACKLMERVIVQQVFQYLKDHNLLHAAQHGFIKGRSTCTNLLESLNDWTLSLECKRRVVVAYVDFSKAFDTVCHEKLLYRLQNFGISGNLLLWLRNYLSDRTHQTRVGGSLSDFVKLLSGAIQGSGIGPLFFICFIDELAKVIDSCDIKVKLFADDVKMYVSVVNNCDHGRLQNALNCLANWAAQWQLTVSINKCYIFNVGRPFHQFTFHISNMQLAEVDFCRDLGVLLSCNLSPELHINDIVAKAHIRANAILRCFSSRDSDLLVRAFKVYVRPLLEYNSVVWSPHLIKHIVHVEQVQRRFTKRLLHGSNLSYIERLNVLKLESLELRRIYFDLLLCYKIFFGLVDVSRDDFFQVNVNSATRGHPYKLFKPYSGNTLRKSFFCIRVVDYWNFLPCDIVDFSSIRKFNTSIALVDFSSFLHLPI
jgi:Reverse transcriptase (RNA-dependent DNA polymerase)/Endonuclease-reverse transcriptase